jgi:hypothetical protein
MVSYKVETIGQLMRNGYWLRVRCRCGNDVKVDPATLWRRVGLGTRVELVAPLLRCRLCGKKTATISVCLVPE